MGTKRSSTPFMDAKNASDLRAARKARTLNHQFEATGSVGKFLLPLSNNIPAKFATQTELLSHTQIRTQEFQLMPLLDQEPEAITEAKELLYEGTKITIPVLRAKGSMFIMDEIAQIFAGYLVPFLTPSVSFPSQAYLVTTISLFASLDPNLTEGHLNGALVYKDIKVNFAETRDVATYYSMFPKYGNVSWYDSALAIGLRTMSFEPVVAIAGVCLQTFGKQVTEVNGEQWYSKRFRALCSILNVNSRESLEDYRPSVNSLAQAHNAISTAFWLRKALMDRMFALKRAKSKVGDMFYHVLYLLANTDITHVRAIDTFVVKMMPEVMNLAVLRQYESNMLEMYRFWDKHQKYFPYVRFYIPQEECTAIQRENLVPLTAAAFAVGSYVHDSFKNYRGPVKDSSLYKSVFEQVTSYLDQRMAVAPLALISSDRSTMTDIEREEMYKRWQNNAPAEKYATMVRDMEGLIEDVTEENKNN